MTFIEFYCFMAGWKKKRPRKNIPQILCSIGGIIHQFRNVPFGLERREERGTSSSVWLVRKGLEYRRATYWKSEQPSGSSLYSSVKLCRNRTLRMQMIGIPLLLKTTVRTQAKCLKEHSKAMKCDQMKWNASVVPLWVTAESNSNNRSGWRMSIKTCLLFSRL